MPASAADGVRRAQDLVAERRLAVLERLAPSRAASDAGSRRSTRAAARTGTSSCSTCRRDSSARRPASTPCFGTSCDLAARRRVDGVEQRRERVAEAEAAATAVADVEDARELGIERAASVNCGERQSIGWRVGASRLPSRRGRLAGRVTAALLDARRQARAGRRPGRARRERRRSVGYLPSVSSAFWNRFACERSAFASVSNQSAISSKPFAARGLGHARIHVRVLVRLAGDRGLQVVARLADRQARGRIADRLEVLEMPVRVARLAFGRRPEHGSRRRCSPRRRPWRRNTDSGDSPATRRRRRPSDSVRSCCP